MKVIFLDHQGVMYIKQHPNPGILDDFNINTVEVLNSILATDSTIEIVVSSDWKYWCSLEEMGDFYEKQGILKRPIGYTPKTDIYIWDTYPKQRAHEIKTWLENNTVEQWVAIDDLDMRPYLKHFVWINKPTEGILQEGACDTLLTHLIPRMRHPVSNLV